ncbi:RAB11-binding protein RELCH homolog isoform X6 [Periophthalmus magnuspinnatus]|uniref:RAB11-binding protein RELCH homolog isoform X6 n=1 Tax=Periophthalmus magnuspinnatus TaxID=409849 RepID=UPI002436D2A1|nr:RAB11-binding protein RELCH homolog isoform X6 [Periophthalmus magnuspinnatus]
MASVNPFNLSDSDEEAERRHSETIDTERSPSDGAPGPPPGNPFSPPADAEPPPPLSSNRTSPSGGEGISVSATAISAMAGSAETRISVDVIAAQLLRDQYILTALELHTELLEAGRELPRLRDYFSNPGNFERQSGTPPAKDQALGPGGPLNRAGSISTLDSLDFARYSDDGNRESDERVAVLEFELRKAKETIQALRANLTQAAESEVPSQERKNFKSSPEIQDFEVWDDVGLNIPKPPDLLQLYRNCGAPSPLSRDMVDVAVEVDFGDLPGNCIAPETLKKPDLSQQQQAELVQELEYQISLLNNEKESLAEQIKKLQSEIQTLKRTVSSPPSTERLSLDLGSENTPNPSSANTSSSDPLPPSDNGQYLDIRGVSESDNSKPPITQNTSQTHNEIHNTLNKRPPVQFDQPNIKLSPAFQQALLSFCRMCSDSRLGAEVSRIADSEQSVMLMLGRCLPHIVPNVLLAKRERMVAHLCQELIPLILCTACLHPEPKERDQLLHILFNLIKRPDDEQRQMILTGCVAFARHVGPTRVEAELLPQCWEQINHKYPERRLLVAEACGALAPYLPKEIRSSLVLSMLQQMLADDKADMVREAVVKSLAIIMGYIDDPDKYSQGFELMLLSLGDPSERVVSAVHQVFIPAFAAWTTELGSLHTALIPSLLARIEKLLMQGEHSLDEHKLHVFLSALQSLIPPLFAVVLQNAPFTSRAKLHGDIPAIEVTRFPRPASPLQDVATIIGSREMLSALLILYDHQLEHEGTTGWESLLWVVNQLLPQLIEIVGRINVTSSTCVHEFSRFFWRFCRTFGKIFTNTKVKPQFQEILRLSEENVDASAGNGILTKATVPIYATGVLTCYNQEEDRKLLVGFLEDVMTTLSLSHAPLDSLKAAFVELGANPVYHELLLTVLWYGVVHTSALVRCTAARMFELLVKGVNETLVAQRVVPALITLSSDPEISVRISTIPAFGTIMETVTQKELLERVKMQLASFLEDPQYQDQHSLHMEIIRTFGRVGPNAEPRFRDEFVLPHLHKLALANNSQTVESKRIDIATQLFEAYSALSCCFISEEVMVNHFLPGLRCLRADMEQLSPEHEVILSSMVKECEIKVENRAMGDPQGSASIASSLVGEDAKTKFLSKMGQLTTSGAMLANVFQRKK